MIRRPQNERRQDQRVGRRSPADEEKGRSDRAPHNPRARSRNLETLTNFAIRDAHDRLLAVAANSATHRSIHELSDLNQDLLAQIEHFFVSYNAAKGQPFEVKRRSGKRRAHALIKTALTSRRR